MSVRIGSQMVPIAQLAAPVALMLFGLAGLLVAGFGQGTMLHEFVHDGRHLLAFPCH